MNPTQGPYSGQKVGGRKIQQTPNFTPEQMQLFQSLFSQVSPDSQTAKLAGGDQSTFEQMEAPALRQFSELQGNIASRFSQGGGGAGALGARNSSGFQNTMNAATSNFAQDLQSKRQELQRQAIQDLMGMSNTLLNQQPYDTQLSEPKEKSSFLQKLLGGSLPLIGAGVGGFFGGPAGAALGGQAGSAASSAFFK